MNSVVMVTGHRPQKLGPNYNFRELITFSKNWLDIIKPQYVIQGGALCFDLAIAAAASQLKIPYTMAIPFPSQPKKWENTDYKIWLKAKERATRVHIVSDDLAPTAILSEYALAMYKRNTWMLEEVSTFKNALVLGLWNGEVRGGTFSAISIAKDLNLPIINLYPEYTKFKTSLVF